MFEDENGPTYSREMFLRDLRSRLKHSKKIAGCCGYEALFGYENIPLAYFRLYRKEAVKYLRKDPKISKRFKPACILTTIASFQYQILAPILRKAGYRMISKGLNMKTNNVVYLYCKTLRGV